MDGDRGGVRDVSGGEQVGHLKGRPADGSKVDVDRDNVVEPERVAVLDERLEHGRFDAGRTPLGVRMADVAEEGDASFFEIRQVAAVVHDPHRVGLGEPDADVVTELVGGGVQRRLDVHTHGAQARPRPAAPGQSLVWEQFLRMVTVSRMRSLLTPAPFRTPPRLPVVAACVLFGSFVATTADASTAPPADETVPGPLVATYDGGVYVLDGETLEVVADIELEGFTRVNPAGDDRHVMVSTGGEFVLLDAVDVELTDHSFGGPEPGHVVRHAGRTVLFSDGSGEVAVFDPASFSSDAPEPGEVYTTADPHHGVAVELANGELLVTLGTVDERVGAIVLDADRNEVARSEDCPGVHGEAAARGETIVLGCQDGVLVYRDGAFTKIASPDEYGRIGSAAGSEESDVILTDYKSDPDAEVERTERVALIDTAAGDMTLVDLGVSYTFRSLARGPHGEALVLGTDGAIHVIDPETAEVVDTIAVVGEWAEPDEWQLPRPALFVRDHTAYVTDPATDEIHAVDIETGEVLVTAALPTTPNEISGVDA